MLPWKSKGSNLVCELWDSTIVGRRMPWYGRPYSQKLHATVIHWLSNRKSYFSQDLGFGKSCPNLRNLQNSLFQRQRSLWHSYIMPNTADHRLMRQTILLGYLLHHAKSSLPYTYWRQHIDMFSRLICLKLKSLDSVVWVWC